MVVLIDNGHGRETFGKRSPDGLLREWAWTREVASAVRETLLASGVDCRLVVEEDNDVSLAERVRRVNAVCAEAGAKNVCLVSVHVNAAGNGSEWKSARGWCCYVSPTASGGSRELARALTEEAERLELMGNRWTPPRKYHEAGYYILNKTRCAAVLTENLFMDNEADCRYLMSAEGFNNIVGLHAAGIMSYLKTKGNL